MTSETIFAVSTPAGRGGVAVIRASGNDAWAGLTALLQSAKCPAARVTALRKLYDPETGDMLDQAMVIGFKAPASFTGEDCVEYHLHGGTAIVQGVLKALSARPNHRMALPGEFTRRAFENGKMDLTAAEAVADLIHAETEGQRLQALKQMDGALFRLYEGWKDRLARLLALMEADLDFNDQDLPDDLLLQVRPDISDVLSEILQHLNDGRRGELLRDGFRLVILGAPNAGKSSLLNKLVQRDAAIVSDIAGTTRDVIDVHLNLGGYPVILADTAGLRGSDDVIESEGMKRAIHRAEQADIKILLFDGTTEPDAQTLALKDDKTLIVINKSDLATYCHSERSEESTLSISLKKDPSTLPQDDKVISISAKTGAGLDDLIAAIITRLQNMVGGSDAPALTRARHREALQSACEALQRFMTAPLPELAAEDLRLAIRHIGAITGRVDVEDLLDMIFRDFCIGK